MLAKVPKMPPKWVPKLCSACPYSTNDIDIAPAAKTKSSAFRGVSWHKASEKWRAQITYMGKQSHLGDFRSEEEAAEAYNTEARRLGIAYKATNATAAADADDEDEEEGAAAFLRRRAAFLEAPGRGSPFAAEVPRRRRDGVAAVHAARGGAERRVETSRRQQPFQQQPSQQPFQQPFQQPAKTPRALETPCRPNHGGGACAGPSRGAGAGGSGGGARAASDASDGDAVFAAVGVAHAPIAGSHAAVGDACALDILAGAASGSADEEDAAPAARAAVHYGEQGTATAAAGTVVHDVEHGASPAAAGAVARYAQQGTAPAAAGTVVHDVEHDASPAAAGAVAHYAQQGPAPATPQAVANHVLEHGAPPATHKATSSRFRGVQWHKQKQRWRAEIQDKVGRCKLSSGD
jgi:hypothetical protein